MKKNKGNCKNNIISFRSGKAKLAAAGLVSLFIGTSTISAFRTFAVAQTSQTDNKKAVAQALVLETAGDSQWSDRKTGLEAAAKEEVSLEAIPQEEREPEIQETAQESEKKEPGTAKKTKQKWNPLIKEGKTVDDSYFDDALFIGASRTQGFQNLSGLGRGSYMTEIGMNVKDVFTKKVVRSGKDKIEISKAIKNGIYGKVYLMFGINEVGWPYMDEFIDAYRKVIQMIKKAQPEAIIYVQSIIQCSEEKASEEKIFGKKNINRFNKEILKMCTEEQVYFLHLNEVLTNRKGYLPSEVTTDGVHMNSDMCKKWLDYLKNHAV